MTEKQETKQPDVNGLEGDDMFEEFETGGQHCLDRAKNAANTAIMAIIILATMVHTLSVAAGYALHLS
jgi:hypothetical protein